jgi:hypothetical protein
VFVVKQKLNGADSTHNQPKLDLFKMLTEEKIGIFQDVTVICHDKKIDLRVTPVEARMRS